MPSYTKLMKKKFFLVNAFMALVVLFAILFQSFDAMSHLEKQFSEKHCHHKYNHSQTEINHAHEGFDQCFACEFAFSSFISPAKISFISKDRNVISISSVFYSKEITQFFRGSLFALRAPPSFIV